MNENERRVKVNKWAHGPSKLPRKRWVCWIVLARGERMIIGDNGEQMVEEHWSPIPGSPIANSKEEATTWAEANAQKYDQWKVVDGAVSIP